MKRLMPINIYTLTSTLHDAAAVDSNTRSFLDGIGLEYVFKGDDYSAFGADPSSVDVIFVRTGGTEGIFEDLLHDLPKDRPFYLLASPTGNSLAASMEILSYLNLCGLKGEIIHGSPEFIRGRLSSLVAGAEVLSKLHGKRLGVIGAPSDWLISSIYDPQAVLDRAGIEIIDIPIGALVGLVRTMGPEAGAGSCPEGGSDFSLEKLMEVPCREGTEEKVRGALEGADKIYRALRELVEEYRLDGLTLRCFDLLTSLGNTGCLALARLNSEGIVATCEGDVPAMLTMLVAQALSGESGFQCNPARMDPEKGEILFAHCTLPLSMARTYNFDTHFESGIGVGIHGEIPEGPVTIMKFDGALRRCYAEEATLVRNEYGQNLCRTQALVRLDEGSSSIRNYFLRGPFGNHHVILPGRWTSRLRSLMDSFSAPSGGCGGHGHGGCGGQGHGGCGGHGGGGCCGHGH